MIKSIYEEAIEILLNMGTEFISVPCNPIGEENSDMIHLRDATETYETNMQGVVKALEQAQKQEKLLELYRCLDENANDYDLHYDKVDEIHNKIDEIEERIKELENDFKRIKRDFKIY